ncbi:MAG: hypothetical protein QXY45_01445 [Candidatus Aenigmatarchaeota archaeon]
MVKYFSRRKRSKKYKTLKNIRFIILVFFILLILRLGYFVLLNRNFDLFENKSENKNESIIIIHSPMNKTYDTKNIIINVSCTQPCVWIRTRIDDGNLSRVSCGNGEKCIVTTDEKLFVEECSFCYEFVRYNLEFKDGIHKIEIKVKDYNGTEYFDRVWFTVDV